MSPARVVLEQVYTKNHEKIEEKSWLFLRYQRNEPRNDSRPLRIIQIERNQRFSPFGPDQRGDYFVFLTISRLFTGPSF